MLGLINVELVEKPTTAYVLQYSEGGCLGTCAFCPQSRLSSSSKDLVSRVSWPKVELGVLINALKACGNPFARICVQNVIKEGFKEELLKIVEYIRDSGIRIPISVATTPVDGDFLRNLKELGVDYLGVGLDAASPRVFSLVKKPYTWGDYIKFIKDSVNVFGRGRVNVHLIYGIGESEVEFVSAMEFLSSLGAEVSLFAFTPVRGIPLENLGRPKPHSYRKMQVLRYLLSKGVRVEDYICYVNDKVYLRSELLNDVIENLDKYLNAFITSGCPGCNRPFYNEGVRGPHYNYPSLKHLKSFRGEVTAELRDLLSEGTPCG